MRYELQLYTLSHHKLLAALLAYEGRYLTLGVVLCRRRKRSLIPISYLLWHDNLNTHHPAPFLRSATTF